MATWHRSSEAWALQLLYHCAPAEHRRANECSQLCREAVASLLFWSEKQPMGCFHLLLHFILRATSGWTAVIWEGPSSQIGDDRCGLDHIWSNTYCVSAIYPWKWEASKFFVVVVVVFFFSCAYLNMHWFPEALFTSCTTSGKSWDVRQLMSGNRYLGWQQIPGVRT